MPYNANFNRYSMPNQKPAWNWVSLSIVLDGRTRARPTPALRCTVRRGSASNEFADAPFSTASNAPVNGSRVKDRALACCANLAAPPDSLSQYRCCYTLGATPWLLLQYPCSNGRNICQLDKGPGPRAAPNRNKPITFTPRFIRMVQYRLGVSRFKLFPRRERAAYYYYYPYLAQVTRRPGTAPSCQVPRDQECGSGTYTPCRYRHRY